MFESFGARAAFGVAVVAFGTVFGGVPLVTPVHAATGCYSGPEGNFGFDISGNACAAPTGASGGSDRWDTTGFVGISFSIGDGFNPHLAVGLRHTNVNASNFVYGGEINASISLTKGMDDAQIRLLAIAGNANALGVGLLGNAGIGWDTQANSLLLNAGLQVPYARFFIDYTIEDKALRAFLEANSYGKIDAVQSTLTCGPGTILADGAEILENWADALGGTGVTGDIFDGSFTYFFPNVFLGTPSSAFVNGQTCYTPGNPTPPV